MADVDPLSLFPTTTPSSPPPTVSSPSGGAAKDDDVLKLFPTTSPAKTTTAATRDVGRGGSLEGAPEADAPAWMMTSAPSSLEDVRGGIQQGETNILDRLRPGPDAGWLEQAGRTAAAVGVHGLSTLAQFPVNALIGLTQGPNLEGPTTAVTYDPVTGQPQLTPEASAAEQLLTGGGPAGRDIRFSGQPNTLKFVPRSATQEPPLPPATAANLLSPDVAERIRSGDIEGSAAPASPTSIPVTPPKAPPSGAGGPQPGAAAAQPQGQFLNGQWLRNAGETGQGYDMGKGGAALSGQVRDALARGDSVQLVADGGNKTVDITGLNNQGMMVDAKGQPWGSTTIASDGTGREGIRITPRAGAAQPGGAQVTPASAAQMTPEQIATQRTVADKQWLNQTQQPGVRDATEHVPGITPSLVEQEQTVTAARELKALKNLNPELSQAEREILDRNTDLRKGFYADTVGSDVTRAADLKAANDKINTDLANVWQSKGEADQAPVAAQIKTELAGSAGDLPPLKSAMKQVGDSLENAGTDPQAMYRTHRLINYLQSRQGLLENPGYGAADVQAALTRTKATLAKTIDDAAPGFGKAMADYSEARGPIDAAKALQDRENGLYDSKGHMSFLKVHGLLRDIIDAQKWDAPSDALAGVSEAQMTRLKALHDDLKRTASAKDLATAQGSDTAMNAVDIAKAYGKLATRAGVEGAANVAFGPGVGSMVVRGAENLLRPITSGIAGRRQIRRGMEILQPPPNPLQPPP